MENNTYLEEMEDTEKQEKQYSTGRPVHTANLAIVGTNFFLVVIGALLCLVAVPVLIICFVKSPSPLQDVYIFGISYYNLLFIFLISAAGIIISSLFFFRFNIPVILVILLTSLFCCLPLVIGLKNDLSLQQAMVNIPYFSNWPFFLRPIYIFVEFLLPAGILIFLFLQLKNIFSKKPNSYAFLAAAVYIGAAASIGFSGLVQSGQPNIMSVLLDRQAVTFVARDDRSTASNRVSGNYPDRLEHLHSSITSQADTQETVTDQPKNSLPVRALPSEDLQIVMMDRKMRLLEDKIDKISRELEQTRISAAEQGQSATVSSESLPPEEPPRAQPSDASAYFTINHRLGSLSDRINLIYGSLKNLKSPVADDQHSAILDVNHKVKLLSGKVELLLNKFSQIEYLMTKQQSPVDKSDSARLPVTNDLNVAPGELTEVLQKLELLSDKVSRVSDMLVQEGINIRQQE